MSSINLAKNVSNAAEAVKGAAGTVQREVKPLLNIEKAMTILRQAKIPVSTSTADNPLVKIMTDLMPLGETDVVAITRTLAQAENFNQMVSEQAGNIKVGERHLKIAESFTSVREDAANMARAAQKPKLSFKDKGQKWIMEKRRGSIHDRFDRIAKDAKAVIQDTQEQLVLEKAVAESYKFLRLALKESTILAGGLRERARERLDSAHGVLKAAQDSLDQHNQDNPQDSQTKDLLELSRDEALDEVSKADRIFQTAEDVYNNLMTSYAASEVVIARLAQATEAKDRVQRQTQAFFSTARTVMTGLATTLTATQGLNESHRTLAALKQGLGDSMDALADLGGEVQKNALREGYSSGMPIEPIQRLLDAVITYQQESHEIIREARKISADNAQKVHEVVETGRRNLISLVQRQALESTAPDALPAANPTKALGHELGVSSDSERDAAEATLEQLRQSQRERVNV